VLCRQKKINCLNSWNWCVRSHHIYIYINLGDMCVICVYIYNATCVIYIYS